MLKHPKIALDFSGAKFSLRLYVPHEFEKCKSYVCGEERCVTMLKTAASTVTGLHCESQREEV